MVRKYVIPILVCVIAFTLCVLCIAFDGKSEEGRYIHNNIGRHLSTLSLNVGFPKATFSNNIEKLSLLISQEDADLVFISEAYGESGDSLYTLLSSLYPSSNYEWGGATNCLYSKYPFRWYHRVAREIDPYAFVCRFYVQLPEEEIALYCCHLSSNNIREDGSYVPLGEVKGLTGRKDYYQNYIRASNVRKKMVSAIIEDVNKENVLVIGDMNDIASSKALSQLVDSGFVNAWDECGKGIGNTIHSPIPLRIDHIYAKNFNIVSASVIATNGLSDHDAIKAKMVLGNQ